MLKNWPYSWFESCVSVSVQIPRWWCSMLELKVLYTSHVLCALATRAVCSNVIIRRRMVEVQGAGLDVTLVSAVVRSAVCLASACPLTVMHCMISAVFHCGMYTGIATCLVWILPKVKAIHTLDCLYILHSITNVYFSTLLLQAKFPKVNGQFSCSYRHTCK